MSKIADNIKHLRNTLGINQSAFGELFELTRDNVASYERGVEPKISTLLKIVNHFHITLDEIVNTDLSNKMGSNLGSNLGSNTNIVTQNLSIVTDPAVEYVPILVNSDGHENIIFVDLKASAGFGAIVNNEKALSEYPKMALPGFLYRGRKQYVAFETDGDSMHPTIQHKDIIITSRIEKATDIKNGFVYTIVCNGAINTKRLHYVKGDDYIDCISDNETYEPFKQPINEITAIYRGEGLVRTQFRNWNNDLRRDMSLLRYDVERIKRKLDL